MQRMAAVIVITPFYRPLNRPAGKGTGKEVGRASRHENSPSENFSASVWSCTEENAGESLLDLFNDVGHFWGSLMIG